MRAEPLVSGPAVFQIGIDRGGGIFQEVVRHPGLNPFPPAVFPRERNFLFLFLGDDVFQQMIESEKRRRRKKNDQQDLTQAGRTFGITACRPPLLSAVPSVSWTLPLSEGVAVESAAFFWIPTAVSSVMSQVLPAKWSP